MKQLLFTLVIILSFTTSVKSTIFENRNLWNKKSDAFKEAYLLGLYEGLTLKMTADTPFLRQWKINTYFCLVGMGATSADLREMVDSYYLDVANWRNNIIMAFHSSVEKACD